MEAFPFHVGASVSLARSIWGSYGAYLKFYLVEVSCAEGCECAVVPNKRVVVISVTCGLFSVF